MSDCFSLEEKLKSYFDKTFEELPPLLRDCVLQEFPMPWDSLSPDLRHSLATKIDTDQSQALQRDFLRRKLALEKQISEWAATGTPTASNLEVKENRLTELQAELLVMENMLARGDYPELGSKEKPTKPPGYLNYDPAWQEMANKIAAEQKSPTGKSKTRNEVANILAKQIGENPLNVLRRIRKQWK